jgi:peptidoglycan/xylan/chitin deacetylase (PgdA/CDA1 family)
VRKYPEVARAVRAAGHEIGNHGDWHLPPPLLPPNVLARELDVGERAIVEVTGAEPRFYRPPFGMMLPSQAAWARRRGYEPVLGDVYPEDPYQPPVHVIVRRVLARLRPGSILILHDSSPWGEPSRARTIAAVERILTHAAERGWRAVSVGELVGPGWTGGVSRRVLRNAEWTSGRA